MIAILTKMELGLIADLLERASEEFSNHTCTDFHVPDMRRSSRRKLAIAVAKWGFDDETVKDAEQDAGESEYFDDGVLMGYFADRLRGEV